MKYLKVNICSLGKKNIVSNRFLVVGLLFYFLINHAYGSVKIYDKFPDSLSTSKHLASISSNYYIDDDLLGAFATFVSQNDYEAGRYYIAIERVKNNLTFITFICQIKDNNSKKIKSLLELNIKGHQIGLITGIENFFLPSESIDDHYCSGDLQWGKGDSSHSVIMEGYKFDSLFTYLSLKEIVNDTSGAIIGYCVLDKTGESDFEVLQWTKANSVYWHEYNRAPDKYLNIIELTHQILTSENSWLKKYAFPDK